MLSDEDSRLFDLLGWLIVVCFAAVVLWQIRRVIVSDAEIEDKIDFVGPFVSVVIAIPMYAVVIEPLQRWLKLGDLGYRLLRTFVAFVFASRYRNSLGVSASSHAGCDGRVARVPTARSGAATWSRAITPNRPPQTVMTCRSACRTRPNDAAGDQRL